MLTVLELFSGIGGFSLGLERTGGFKTVAGCEIDPFCRQVLAKHWPEVPIHDDIRTLNADWLAEMGAWPDVICGGFPCTDISLAGKGAGITGPQSGLWREYARLIGEIRPRYVLVENVAALLGRGLGNVLGGLAALGYDAEWHCIPASYVGAPHRRDRVWIIAHSDTSGIHGECDDTGSNREGRREGPAGSIREDAANAPIMQRDERHVHGRRDSEGTESLPELGNSGCVVALANPNRPRLEIGQGQRRDARPEQPAAVGSNWWQSEPDVGRVAYGVPARVDRLKALGNAVVPQIPELIGLAIMEANP